MPTPVRREDVLRPLLVLMAVAFAVSVVHYIDNTVNYADYPQVQPGSALPNPSATVIGGAWFVFTAFGAVGLWLFARGRITAAAIAIAVYSGTVSSGTSAHVSAGPSRDMVWWRQTHVIADILCRPALFAFALSSASGCRTNTTSRLTRSVVEPPRSSAVRLGTRLVAGQEDVVAGPGDRQAVTSPPRHPAQRAI